MTDEFKEFAADVFESRAEHISDGLAHEQIALRDRYAFIRDRELNRATVALAYLRAACPLFNWHKYRADPEPYMRRMVANTMSASASGDGAGVASTAVSGGDSVEPGAGEDDDDGGGSRLQSVAVKRLLYTLNGLRTELTRADCEGQRLYDDRTAQAGRLAELNDELSEVRCRAAEDMSRLKDELTLLRQRTAEQTAHVDRLLETAQVHMQSRQTPTTGC